MRVYGDIGQKPIECINPPKDRWAVRWDFRDEENGVSYEEKVFDHEPTPEEIEVARQELVAEARAELIALIAAHDTSGAVNTFFVKVPDAGSIGIWLNREERSALRIRFEAEQRVRKTSTTLWVSGLSITISPDMGLGMLDALELYAAASYDRTQQHIIAVSKLASGTEFEEYDYEGGYPEKITFEINQ
jgi:hypothetical protein